MFAEIDFQREETRRAEIDQSSILAEFDRDILWTIWKTNYAPIYAKYVSLESFINLILGKLSLTRIGIYNRELQIIS